MANRLLDLLSQSQGTYARNDPFPQGQPQPRPGDLTTALAGNLTGAAGSLMDIAYLGGTVGNKVFNPLMRAAQPRDVPGTTDWIATKTGQDPSDPAFIAGSMTSPGGTASALGKALAMLKGGQAMGDVIQAMSAFGKRGDENLITPLTRNGEPIGASNQAMKFASEDHKNRVDFYNTPEGENYRLPNLNKIVPKGYAPKQAGDKTVTVYRGVSTKVDNAEIRPGDWVTLDAEYAKRHGTGETGASKVIEMQVPADEVAWAGTDMNEYFYAPRKPLTRNGEPIGKAAGENTGIRVYHGTDADIEQLERGFAKTARDFYTTPIREDAAGYGRNVLEFEFSGKLGDFTPEARGAKETKILREVYKEDLTDYWESFDDFLEAFDSGDMYQQFASSGPQDDVIGGLIAKGFDGVKIPDAGFGGAISESIVVQNPKLLKPIK